MKIEWVKGKKGDTDRILQITTTEKEAVTIFKLCLLANQLAVNELKINKEKIERYGNFFFKNCLNNSVEMAEKNIDWAEEKNIKEVEKWCRKFYLSFEKIEPELRKTIQMKVIGYGRTN